MTQASQCSNKTTYYERHKEQRRELNKTRALNYYYKNIEERREYNKNYWKLNNNMLYNKRRENKDYLEYQKHYNEQIRIKNINGVYELFLKKDNPELKKSDMIIKCYFD